MMSPGQMTTRQKIILGIVIVVVVLALAAAIYLMIRNPAITSALADISIVVLALGLLVLDILLVVMVFQIYRLLVYLMAEIVPIMENLQETVGTVRGTATFMSDSVVNPSIQMAGRVAGVRRSLNVLFNGPGSGTTRKASAGRGTADSRSTSPDGGPSDFPGAEGVSNG